MSQSRNIINLAKSIVRPSTLGMARGSVLSPSLYKIIMHDIGFVQQRCPSATIDHLRMAAKWLKKTSLDDGGQSIAMVVGSQLMEGYPETTGYTIPTLLRLSKVFTEDNYQLLAKKHGSWLLGCIDEEGGVKFPNGYAVAFDTAQVLDGFTALYSEYGNENYKQTCTLLASWLNKYQDPEGGWSRHDYHRQFHAYSTRVSSILLKYHAMTGCIESLNTAIKNLERVIKDKNDFGWFRSARFGKEPRVNLHSLAYILEGFWHSYCYTNEKKYLLAAVELKDNLIRFLSNDGRMPGEFYNNYKPDRSYECLTGQAQLAYVLFEMAKYNDLDTVDTARLLSENLKKRQLTYLQHELYNGGIPGSYPIFGNYSPFMIINWGAKYACDMWMSQLDL